nr:AraC family transcriptional regulator [Hufsiella arboris]
MLKLIDENLQREELDVDYLCKNLFISRTGLYQKIKSISDQPVGEFIRTARLNKGVYIMTHEDINLNELIDRIGFQSVSYFSRAFKKEFGVTQSQFVQDLNKKKQLLE